MRELSFVTPDHDLSSVFAFEHRYEKLSNEHPEWFLEKSKEREVDSTLREFRATIKSIQETTNGIAVELDAIQARIVNVAFWAGAIAVAFYVIRTWL